MESMGLAMLGIYAFVTSVLTDSLILKTVDHSLPCFRFIWSFIEGETMVTM